MNKYLSAIPVTSAKMPRAVLWSAITLISCVQSSVLSAQEDVKVLYQILGSEFSERMGVSVSGAGDVNRDGFADVIVGATGTTGSGPLCGSAKVLSGKDGSILYTFKGDNAEEYLGYSVAGAGDVNNDGYDDVIVGLPWADERGNESGSAKVFSGQTGALLWRFNGDRASDYLGSQVSGAGDVDGDGYHDLIVGVPFNDFSASNAGMARVYSGRTGAVLYERRGSSEDDQFGTVVSGAGDVNKDGFADFLVGSRLSDRNGVDAGLVAVFSGKDGRAIHSFKGENAYDRFGSAAAGAGDVNRDGYADIIVARQDSSNNNLRQSGSIKVFSGKDGSALYALDGEDEFGNFGFSVAGAGDYNGDGYDDFIVGAPYSESNVGTGKAHVFSGKDAKPLYTFYGGSEERAGWSVSGAGDANRDGYADLIVGGIDFAGFILMGGRALVISDGCPNDSVKAAPGQCGCGVVDTDRDKDGTADCVDKCPDDPTKIDNCQGPLDQPTATPTPTPASGPAPKLLNAPKVRFTRGLVRIWVEVNSQSKPRIIFAITGPKNLTAQGKAVKRSNKGIKRYQTTLLKLPKGSYQVSWELVEANASRQMSVAKVFTVK